MKRFVFFIPLFMLTLVICEVNAQDIKADISPEQRASIKAIEKAKEDCRNFAFVPCQNFLGDNEYLAYQTIARSIEEYYEVCSLPKLNKETGHYIANSSKDLYTQIDNLNAAYHIMYFRSTGPDKKCYNYTTITSLAGKSLHSDLGSLARSAPDYIAMKQREDKVREAENARIAAENKAKEEARIAAEKKARDEKIAHLTSELKAKSQASPTCLSTCLKQKQLDEIMTLKGEKGGNIPELYLRTNGKVVPSGYTKEKVEALPNLKLCKSLCIKD